MTLELYIDEHAHMVHDFLLFAVCKNDDVLQDAKARLRGLEKFMKK